MKTRLHKHKTIGFAMLLFLTLLSNVKAQVANSSNYAFSTGNNASLLFDMNANPINLNNQPDLMVPGSSTTLATMDIGFDFWFMGTRHFQLTPLVRGVVGLGPLVPSAATVNLNQVALSNAPLLAPFWNNNTFSPATGRNLRTTVVGVAPNRCFVFEWRLMSNTSYFGAGDMIFQMRLYETSGIIEYVYDKMNITPGSASTVITQAAIGFTQNRNLNNTLASVTDLTSYNNTFNSGSVNNAVASQHRSGQIAGLESGRYFRYSPSNPVAPTNITFSGVTNNSMTVNWNDNSSNELGFAVYRSDDNGASYNFITLTPQNINTLTQAQLNPSTNYLYRIFAVTEGGVSNALLGNQTTLSSTTISSTATGGPWSSTSTWVGGVIPSITNNVTIADGATVIIDNLNATCNNLTVGQGGSGVLRYSGATVASLFVNGNVTVATSGIFDAAASSIQNHNLTIGGFNNNGTNGNLTVNGIFDMNFATSPNSGSGVITTFGGQGSATISGTGSVCDFYSIVVNKGTFPMPNQNPILDVNRIITINAPTNSTNRLTITNGTFKINSASNLLPYNGTQTICATGGRLWLNNAGCSIGANGAGTFLGAGSPTVSGELRIDNGSFTYGSGINTLTFGTSAVLFNGVSTTFGSKLVMNGGTLTMYGAISFASSTAVHFNMSGGNIFVDPQSANILASTTTAFIINTATTVNWSGGTVTIVDPPSAQTTTATVSIVSGGQKSVTGGKVKIGDGVSTSGSGPLANNTGFLLNITAPIWDLEIDNKVDVNNTRICRLGGVNLILNNVVVNNNAYLMLSSAGASANLTVYENIINNGIISGVEPNSTGTSGLIHFIDSVGTQTVSGTGQFNNLNQITLAPNLAFINSTNNVIFNQSNNINVNTVVLTTGTLTHNGKLIIGRPNIVPFVQIGGNGHTVTPGKFATVPIFDNSSFANQYTYSTGNKPVVLGEANEIGSNTSVIHNLVVNNHNGLTIDRNLTVVNVLQMSLGNISIGNNNLTLGSGSTNIGTLTYTAGNIICGTTGTFTRWYNTTAAPTTVSAASQFPLGGITDARFAYVYFNAAGALSAPGTISVGHANAFGTTSFAGYTENAVTIDTRTNAAWNISAGNGITLGTGTASLSLRGDGAVVGLTNATNIVVTNNNGTAFAGLYSAGTGTVTNSIVMQPLANRTGITSLAILSSNPICMGAPSANIQSVFSAVKSGQWNNPNNWATGIVPIITDNVIIPLGVTLSTDSGAACNANLLSIMPGGTLNVNGNSLTIARNFYLNGSVSNFDLYGKLNLSAGTLNVVGDALQGGFIANAGTITNITGGIFNIGNGTDCSKTLTLNASAILYFYSGAINVYGSTTISGVLNQLSGSLSIYPLGPIAGPLTTAASAVGNSFNLLNSAGSFVGGTINIIDPPFEATANSVFINANAASFAFAGNHTVNIGNGLSTLTNGVPFRLETYQGGYVPLQNLNINGGNTPNRHAETSTTTGAFGLQVKGTMNIENNSEFRHTTANLLIIGTSLVNNGTLTIPIASTLTLGINAVITGGIGNVTLSGTGVFQNSVTSSTASIGNLTMITGNVANRVIVNVNNLSISNTLTLTSGQLDLGSNNLTLGSISATTAGTLTHTAGAQILTSAGGSFTRVFAATGFPTVFNATGLYPFGKFNATNNTVERRDFYVWSSSATSTTGGAIQVTPSYADGTSTTTSILDGAFTTDLRTNSSWKVNVNGLALSTGLLSIKCIGENAGILPSAVASTTLRRVNAIAGGNYLVGSNSLGFTNTIDFNRSGLSISDIDTITFFGGGSTTSNLGGNIVSVSNGDWNSPSTWSSNSVPTASDNVQILPPYTVMINGGSTNLCNNLFINNGGSLIANNNTLTIAGQLVNMGAVAIGGSTLNINTNNVTSIGINNNANASITLNSGTINIGPVGGGMATLSNAGTLTINAGNINLNGNFAQTSAATSILNMLGGNLTIDGNSNNPSTSVVNGTALMSFGATGTQNIIGGIITIVDPHYGAIGGGFGSAILNSGTATWTNNILRFGDGVSTHTNINQTTTTAFQTLGFHVNSASANLGNIVVNGNGTNRWVTTNGFTLLATSLTIEPNSEYRSSTLGTNVLNLTGNLVNNGTLTLTSASTLTLSGTGAINVSGTGVFRVDTNNAIASNFNNLTISNTGTLGANFNIGNFTVSGALSLSGACPLNIGGNILTLGTSATSLGTLSSVVGTIVHTTGGGFRRWYAATAVPTTAATTSQFPIGVIANGTVLRRDFYVFSSIATLTTGGTFTVSHSSNAGTTSLTPYTDGTLSNVATRSNSFWNIANNGITTSGTFGINAVANGIIMPITLAQTTLCKNTGTMSGNYVAATGSQASPNIIRTPNISLADLTSTPGLYVAAPATNFTGNVFSVASGNWSDPTTWSNNAVPAADDNVTINANHFVNLDANGVARDLTIAGFGALTANANNLTVSNLLIGAANSTLIINGGSVTAQGSVAAATGFASAGNVNLLSGSLNIIQPAANNRTLSITAGIFNVAGGSLSINGNISFTGGTWQQSGGTITVDGNSGVGSTSVASATNIVNFAGSLQNVTGGTMVIVNPHFGTTGLAFNYGLSTNVNWTNHTLQFGDGVSTIQGGTLSGVNRMGFAVSTTTATATGRLTLHNVIVNGGGVHRQVTVMPANTNSIDIGNNLTINANSELRTIGSTAAASFVNVGGNIINNGRLVIASNNTLGFRLNATNASLNAQSITGTGVLLNDTSAICNPCLSNMIINNFTSQGVNMSSLTGTLTIDQPAGTIASNLTMGTTGSYLNLGSNNLVLGRATLPATLTGTFTTGNNGLILTTGSITRGIGAAAITGTLGTFPLGLPNTPINFNRSIIITSSATPTTNGTITVSHANIAGTSALVPYQDGGSPAVTIDRRLNTNWTISNTGLSGAVLNMQANGFGLNSANITDVSQLRLTSATGVAAGSAGVNTNTIVEPQILRTGLTDLNLSGSYYVGGNAVNPMDFPPLGNNSISGTQTVCSQNIPAPIVGSNPTGGTGNYSYNWISSTTSATSGYALASGTNTDLSYQAGLITQNTWFRRIATSGSLVDTSASVLVTVNMPVATNSISSAQTICNGNTPASLIGTVATGGDGTNYNYSWLVSTTNANTGFVIISGANALGYSPSALTQNTWYRRLAQSGACSADSSAAIMITVNPLIANNSITSTVQTICSGTAPSNIVGSTPTGGSGTYTYLWLTSTSSATTGFTASAGTNNGANYTSGILTAETWFRRITYSGTCSADTSLAQIVNINAAPAVSAHPINSTIGNGGSTSFSVTATGTGLTYQWQVNTGSGYSNLTNNATYSGVTLATLSLTNVSSAMDGYLYRCVVSGTCNPSANSNGATLNVNTAPAITTQPSNATVCSGSGTTFNVVATGTGLTYQWQIDIGSGFSNLTNGGVYTGATASILNISSTTSGMNNYDYRCVVTSTLSSTSNSANLNVNTAVSANTATGVQTICNGSVPASLNGSTPSGGNGTTYTYTWLSSTTSATAGFALATGTNNNQNYSPAALSANTWFKRRVVSGVCSADTSSAILVTVNQVVANNTATGSQTICSGNTPSLFVGSTPTGGNGTTYSYSWIVSTTSATSGYAVASGTSTNQNYSSSALTQNSWFRRIATSGACEGDTSAAILVTVNPVIANNTQSANQNICSGSTPAALVGSTPTGGSGVYSYTWLSSTLNANAGFVIASGVSNTINYTPSALTANTWYKRLVSSGTCTDSSMATAITVNPAIANNSVSGTQTICNAQSPSTLTGGTPTGGSGVYTYNWIRSTTSSTSGYSNAPGVNNTNTYSSAALTTTSYFRRVVNSGGCVDTSAAITVTVNPAIANNTSGLSTNVCQGSSAILTGGTATGGTSTYTYQWQSSLVSATAGFANATGTSTSANYTTAAINANTWFRRVVSSGSCVDSGTVANVSITTTLANNTASGNQTICSGDIPTAINGTTPTGGANLNGVTTGVKFAEEFDLGAASTGWLLTNPNNLVVGSTTYNSFGRAGTLGAIYANNYTVQTGTAQVDSRIFGATNTIDSLRFDVAARTYQTEMDSLIIFANTGSGFNTVVAAYGTKPTPDVMSGGITTLAANTANYTVPASTDWFTRALPLPVGTIQVRFAFRTAYGNNIHIDRVRVDSSSTTNYLYTWQSSTTSATAGYTNATGTNNSQNYTPAALTQNTWYRRVVSSNSCADTSTAVMVTVNPVIANNTVNSAQTICSGSAPALLTGTTPTGGTGTFTYRWESSTVSGSTGFVTASGTNNQANYTSAALTTTTWFRRVAMSGACSNNATAIQITVTPTIANNTATGNATVCTGNTVTYTGSTPTGGSGTNTYLWQSSTTSATTGFAAATGTNNLINYTSGAITANTWFRRVVISGNCTDTSIGYGVTTTNTNTWAGSTSNAWGTASNWGCGTVPTITSNVVINTGASFMPLITDNRAVNKLTIGTGANLTVNNTAARLAIYDSVYASSGSIINTLGTVAYAGATAQNILPATYNRLEIANTAGVVLNTGNVTIVDSLKFTSGRITLGSNNITLGNNAIVSGANTTSYVNTNGTGSLTIQNIGTGGKTGAVIFPVGNTNYTPATLTNAGTADDYIVRVVNGVNTNGLTGTAITSNAVNKTWVIDEAVAGGSNATVTLQWNTADELTGFTRANSYVARHNGITWLATTASAAAGTNPYTQTRTGITSFSPFGVGSGGTLPVKFVKFTAEPKNTSSVLNWVTSTEVNNDYFMVERSLNNKTFTSIGKSIKGAGNSNQVNAYNFIDEDASRFANGSSVYYRIRQVDFNGEFSYTETKEVSFSDFASDEITVMPNPFEDNVMVKMYSNTNKTQRLVLTDMFGKTIIDQNYNLSYGENVINLNELSNLPNAVYFITIGNGSDLKTIKVVKNK